MSRRGENIRKRKDGRWEGRYIDSYSCTGKACYHSIYGKNYTEVKEKLKQYKSICNQNIRNKITMAELFEEWLIKKKSSVKSSSYVKYYGFVENHFAPYFGKTAVKYLTAEHVQEFLSIKNYLSEKTICDMISVLLQIIKYAQSMKYIGYFDFELIRYPKIPYKELHILSPSEVTKLVQYIQKTFEIRKIGVFLSLFMGMRIGEICALQWCDVNFADEIIHIEKTMQRLKTLNPNSKSKTEIVVDTPKSQKSIRDIPIPSFLLNLLKSCQADNNSYVLTGTVKYIEPTIYERMFHEYLNSAGIAKTNFHALRHTFATRAVEQGFDIKSLSELLGHSSVKFTMERYVHPSEEHKKMNLEKLSVFY